MRHPPTLATRWKSCAVASLLASICLVTACTSLEPEARPSLSTKIAAIKQHTQRAEALEQSGEWLAARRAWWVVDALAPNHYQAGERIDALTARLDAEAQHALSAARDAARRGRKKTAVKHALAALSFRQDLPEAQSLLRNLEKQAATRRAMRRREDLSVLRAPSNLN